MRVRNRAVRRSLSSVLALTLVTSVVMIAPTISAGVPANSNIDTAIPVPPGGMSDTVMSPVTNEHAVWSIALSAGDTLVVGGSFGPAGASAAARIYHPTATSVLVNAPIAVAEEGTTTVQYTATEAGTYFIDIMYSCPAAIGYQFMATIIPGGGMNPDVTFEPNIVNFAGSTGGAPPANQVVTITIAGDFPLTDWWLYNIPSWLSIEPTGGVAPGVNVMTISVDTSGLASGAYSADIQVGVDVSTGTGFSSAAGFSRAAVGPTSYGILPVRLAVTPAAATAPAATALTLAASTSTPGYRKPVTLAAKLSAGAAGVSGQTVVFERLDGATWVAIGSAVTGADGAATLATTAYRDSKTTYRARFDATAGYTASTSASVVVRPKVYLSKPNAPKTMYKGKAKAIAGYLKPKHTAGTYPVRIYKYRSVSGKWKSYGYVKAKASNYSTYTKYSKTLSLPYKGKWKLRAVAPADSKHAKTYSSYDYVTVK